MTPAHTDVLSRLHHEHRARLERIVASRTRDPDHAQDVVSESFARLQGRMAGGWEPDDPAAWLTRVAINIVTSEGRHRQVVRRVGPRLGPRRHVEPPDDEVMARDLLRRVGHALDGLSREDRSLVMEAARGASGATLGAAHGCTDTDARVRLHRARRRLRDAVDQTT